MDSPTITLPIPHLSSFSGDLNSVISSIARNIQIITASINTIRQDQYTLFSRDLPAIQQQQALILRNQQDILNNHTQLLSRLDSISSNTSLIDDLNSKIDLVDNKINSLSHNSSSLSHSINSLPSLSSLPVSKSLSVRYCDREIPDSDLSRLSPDDLTRLKHNISSSKWKYKQEGKLDLVNMCQLNMDRINSFLSTPK
jgi:hypothetical protein